MIKTKIANGKLIIDIKDVELTEDNKMVETVKSDNGITMHMYEKGDTFLCFKIDSIPFKLTRGKVNLNILYPEFKAVELRDGVIMIKCKLNEIEGDHLIANCKKPWILEKIKGFFIKE